nr:hypothetical protein [Tanacetum cinerariifolium]
MIAILEKYEHNVDFHQIVDFVEAFHIRQYSRRARIAQSLALPTAADEPASFLRDDSQGEAFPTVSGLEARQDRENIIKTSALPHDSPPRVTSLAADEGNKDRGGAEPSREDATIKGRSLEIGEKAGVEKSTERGKVSIVGIPTGSGLVPTASPIFTTASVVTPYSRRKGKDKMVESDMPKKKKLQEHIDIQVAREMEEQMAREDQRRNKQITRDAEIARIHAEEELQMLIDCLDKNNEIIANKQLSKKQQREFYMLVLKSHSGWKTKHFKGMILEEIREKFIPVWKQIEDFVPMASKEEEERMKRKGLRLEQESTKKMKTSEEISKEDLKEMMQLVPVEKIIRLGGHTAVYQFFVDMLKHFDREDLNQLWTLVKETLSIRQATGDKEKELWVELKRLFKPAFEDQLWTHTQALMHDPVEWRLYDTCDVHHVLTRDQEIFMLVEKDYPPRKGLAIVMISNKLQGRIVRNKMLKSFPLPVKKFPLPEYFPTASEEMFLLLSQKDAPAEEVYTAEKLKVNRGQRHIYVSQRRVSVILGRCSFIVPIIYERQLMKHRVQDSLSYKRSP